MPAKIEKENFDILSYNSKKKAELDFEYSQ